MASEQSDKASLPHQATKDKKKREGLTPPRFPAVGEAYRPFRIFNGCLVPFTIVSLRDLSPGAKLLFGELASLLGEKGFCQPSLGHLASRLGKSVDTIGEWLQELTAYGLVKGQRRGPGSHTERVFIWHPVLDRSLKDGAVVNSLPLKPQTHCARKGTETANGRNESNLESANLRRLEPQKCGVLNPQIRGALNKEEEVLNSRGSIEEESSSSPPAESPVQEGLTPEVVSDDDDPDPIQETQGLVRASLLEFVTTCEFKLPAGKIPDEPIAKGLRRMDANIGDLIEFLRKYRDRLRAPPATWNHLLIAFQHWAADPRILTDFRGRAALRIEKERQQAADRERQRLMAMPSDPGTAIRIAEEEGQCFPPVFHDRLVRLGDALSPATAIDQARVWRSCQSCRGEGMVGNALAKTLSFCECFAGEERRHRDGPDYPKLEIAKVHATMQSRLVAAAHECNLFFAADTLELSEVMDDGRVLTILAPGQFGFTITIQDVHRILAHLGEERRIEIPGVTKSEATVQPISIPKGPAERLVVSSAVCHRCTATVALYSDGTGQNCRCGRRNIAPIERASVLPIDLARKAVAR